jgi:hypothetical protein
MPSLTLTQKLAESIHTLSDKIGQTPDEILLAMNKYVEAQAGQLPMVYARHKMTSKFIFILYLMYL